MGRGGFEWQRGLCGLRILGDFSARAVLDFRRFGCLIQNLASLLVSEEFRTGFSNLCSPEILKNLAELQFRRDVSARKACERA